MTDPPATARRRRAPRREGGTLRDEQRRRTRRLLADAALELFTEAGYASVTIDHIARRAGANRATFYLHYAGKADVVLELLSRLDDDMVAVYAAADALEDPAPEDVRAWLAGAIGFWDRHRIYIEIGEQALGVEPRVADSWLAAIELGVRAMPRHLARFQGAERERARVRLVALMMELERLCYFWIVGGADLDREHVLDVLTEQWWPVLAHPT
jgi:AcrR family transcriptional regulator